MLFVGTLHSVGYIFPFLPCFLLVFFPWLFVKLPQKTTLSSCVSSSPAFLMMNSAYKLTPDGQYRNQTDYILCSQRWRSSLQSVKTRLRADCGSDHELLIAKFRLKLKKVGKTTRPFRYDLNQIPYDYTVELRNRFKGLDLIDRVPD